MSPEIADTQDVALYSPRPSRQKRIYRPAHLRTRPLSARVRTFVLVCVQLAVLSILTALAVTSPSSAAAITTTAISAGGGTTCAIRTGGVAYCWGDNTYGQLGNGTTTNSSTPVLVSGNYTWASISTLSYPSYPAATTCGVTTSGAGYCWGYNGYGSIGDGTTTNRSSPTAVSGAYTWSSILVGEGDTCGVTTSGSGYCWGNNGNGSIGDGTTTNRTTPTIISGGYTWSQISDGNLTTCGVTTTGAGYCWGWN